MDKRFLGILGALIIIFGGIFVVSQKSSTSTGGGDANKATNHVTGKGQKGVTLMEYGDYQCPICGLYYPSVKQVTNQLNNDIYFQFRNLPLPSLHKNAYAAARAAEAAGIQNKYWEMHDKLYENQAEWSENSAAQDIFNKYAQQIGLDVTKFKQDYAGSQVNSSINADLAAFAKTGQEQATPSFFINGKFVPNGDLGVPSKTNPGQLDLDATVANFVKAINAEIANQKKQ